MTLINNFKDVAEFQLCCGCGVCAYLYPNEIEMVDVPEYGRRPLSKKGGNSPEISLNLEEICPGIHLAADPSQPGHESIDSLSDSWGTVIEIWEGYASDPDIRYRGASGGAISAIALYCLEQGNMEGAINISAERDRPYLNRTVFSRTREDILGSTGSRYSPASPCEGLQKIEDAHSPCVFIGKPCDVAAVSKARRIREKLDKNLGLTMACFCAGTPSTEGTLEMLGRMGVAEPESLSGLRYRGYGWPGKTVAEQNVNKEKVTKALDYTQSWGEILQKYRQWRCYICPDHSGEFADIAVGDPWYRTIEENENGYSLIVARSTHGKEIIRAAIESNYLTADKVSPETLPRSQPNLLKTRGALWGRLLALRMLGAPCPEYENMPLLRNWLLDLNIREKGKSVLGTIKRCYSKRLKHRCQFMQC